MHTFAHAQLPIHSVVVCCNICRLLCRQIHADTDKKTAAHYCITTSKFSIVLQNLEVDMHVTIFLSLISLSTSLLMEISVFVLSSTSISLSTES